MENQILVFGLILCFMVTGNAILKDDKFDADLFECRKKCYMPKVYFEGTLAEGVFYENYTEDFNLTCVSSCLNLTNVPLQLRDCDEVQVTNEGFIPEYDTSCNSNKANIKFSTWLLPQLQGNIPGLMVTVTPCSQLNWSNMSISVSVLASLQGTVSITPPLCYVGMIDGKVVEESVDEYGRTRINYIVNHGFLFNFMYKVNTILEPIHEAELVMQTWITPKCHEINRDNPCFCATSGVIYPETVETELKGYTLHIRIPTFLPCFKVTYIKVNIQLREKKFPRTTFDYFNQNIKVNKDYKDQDFYFFEFHNIYEQRKGWDYVIVLLIETALAVPEQRSYRALVNSTTWRPTTPEVELLSNNEAEVRIRSAHPLYRIGSYWLLVEFRPMLNTNNTFASSGEKVIFFEDQINVPDLSQKYVNTTLRCLKPGHYTITIRENRETKQEALTKMLAAPWSGAAHITIYHPLSQSCIDKKEFVAHFVVLAITVTVLVIFIIFCLYIWKKGLCYKMSRRLPSSMSKWLDLQTLDVISMHSCTIWLIWQTDERSTALRDAHSENIRHFCSYLATVCGINVIVDLFEEQDVIQGYAQWIQEAYERAQYVVFVCPHYQPECDGQLNLATVGNFTRSYMYVESLISNRKKYITVVLPYAEHEATPHGRWLKNVTMNYYMMKDIEAFYFHLQGTCRLFVNGRVSVQYISSKDYHLTNEGAALQSGIKKFAQLMSSCDDMGGDDEEAAPLNGAAVVEDDDISSPSSPISLSWSPHDKSIIELQAPSPPSHQLGPLIAPPEEPIKIVYQKLEIEPPTFGQEEIDLRV